MPEEVFFLAALGIIAGLVMVLTIVRTVYSLVRRKQDQKATGQSSLTTSDLESMMRRAVADAVAPLAAQIEALEDRVDTQRQLLNAAPRHDLLELDDDEVTQEVSARRRSRQSH